MTQNERLLSNQSYTNKDFSAIYPELLDLAQKISYKWNPAESDESDPGVVLLKLAALMADKNNYNIDKNVLETFPLSVTQLQNARQLFEQCGYCMKYYQSGTTVLTLTMNREPELPSAVKEVTEEERSYTIPRFTMVSDLENSVVYTTVTDCIVKSTKESVTVDAIQGIINEYTINGDPVITYANLDYNNRLYFTELDIPENGIFVENISKTGNSESWKSVDNLLLEPVGTLCYKFGLSENGTRCYIEFPEDISELIGQGLSIHYLRTAGASGNIGRKRLTQLYTDVTATVKAGNSASAEVSISTYENSTSGNLHITNIDPVSNGSDPESIDDAYRNYQRVKTTFDTLVSAKDYENFLYTNQNISNGYVCDRTNDIQSTHLIINDRGTLTTSNVVVKEATVSRKNCTVITRDTDGIITNREGPVEVEYAEPEMSAFDLRIYGLTYVDDPTTDLGFNKSFRLILPDAHKYGEWGSILMDTEDIKSIQHNYKLFEPGRILMLFNCYPIVSRIIPINKVDEKQQIEIITAVKKALYSKLNSRVVEFGSPIQYEDVYDTILNADPRIKAITLNDIEYETHALYLPSRESTQVELLRIDDKSSKPESKEGETIDKGELWDKFRSEIYAKSVLAGKTPLFVQDVDNPFEYALTQSGGTIYNKVKTITTNTSIQFRRTSDGTKYQIGPTLVGNNIRPNENIIFRRKSLVDASAPFGSYVKFLHNISTTVDKDDMYQLGADDYIAFFWKKEDGDNIPYTYIKYGAGTIITPTFTLNSNQPNPDHAEINHEFLKSLKSDVEGTTTSPEFAEGKSPLNVNQFSNHSEEERMVSFNEFVTELKGSNWVLTGTNQIQCKKVNQDIVSSPDTGVRKICWALNNTTNTLFFTNDTSYMLKEGEYFFCTNATNTQILIYGGGTIITRTGDSSVWQTNKKFDFNSYVVGGTDYITEEALWYTPPKAAKVTLIETEFIQLSKDCSIDIVYDSADTLGDENNTIRLNITSTPMPFIGCSIYYKESKDAQLTKLSRVYNSQDEELAWKGSAVLNLEMTAHTPLVLEENQSLTLYTINETEGELLDATTSEDKETTIQSTHTIRQLGGENLDVTTIDLLSGEVIYPSLYVYTHEKSAPFGSTSNSTIEITPTACTITLPPSTGSSYWWKYDDGDRDALPVFMPGTYVARLVLNDSFERFNIVPIKPDTDDEVDLRVTINVLQYADFLESNTAAPSGEYFIKLLVSEDSGYPSGLPIKLKFTYRCNTQASFTLLNFMKYTQNSMEDEIIEQFKELDADRVFNMLYEVPEDLLIENPLQAASFMDSEHVMNKFTICRWISEQDAQVKTDEKNKITVTNRIK